MENLRLGILIPNRGCERVRFMENLIRMIEAQTFKPVHIELVDFEPTNEKCDITKRYRIGYENMKGKGLDLIALMEVDDFYSPEYLEYMVSKWFEFGKPKMLGTAYTIYYHIKLLKWFTFEHYNRASAMNTFIVPDLDIDWPVDEEPYTDIHLWRDIQGVVFTPEKHYSLGIKHGDGKVGGQNHVDKLDRFIHDDSDLRFLTAVMDKDSFLFYTNYYNGMFDNSETVVVGELTLHKKI